MFEQALYKIFVEAGCFRPWGYAGAGSAKPTRAERLSVAIALVLRG